MRILRHKHNRKTLNFFRIVFGVIPPYKCLCDGNFIAQAVRMANEPSRTIPKMLESPTFLHVTECILRELESIGPKASAALEAAKALGVIRCSGKHGHTDGRGAADCLTDIVAHARAENKSFFVATQDADLRDALRKIPGTPIVMFSQNVLILEPPSSASKETSASKAATTSSLTPEEAAAVKKAKKAEHMAAVEGLPKPIVGVKRKHRGPSEPNPLSRKKKTSTKPAAPASAGAGARDGDEDTAGSGMEEPTEVKKTRRAGSRHKRARTDDQRVAAAADSSSEESD
jgi:U3 small nucleolar RNA-associated protein 23